MKTLDLLTLAREANAFERHEPRVSRIGYCQKKHVAECLGKFTTEFPRFYTVMGHALQGYYASELGKNATVFNELELETSQKGVFCHPDLYLSYPKARDPRKGEEWVTRGIQVKTINKWGMKNLKEAKQEDIEQAKLEWWFWRLKGYARHGKEMVYCPQEYELLYIERPDVNDKHFVERIVSFPIGWDEVSMRLLQERFDNTGDCIELGILPPHKHTIPQYECKDCAFIKDCFNGEEV